MKSGSRWVTGLLSLFKLKQFFAHSYWYSSVFTKIFIRIVLELLHESYSYQ